MNTDILDYFVYLFIYLQFMSVTLNYNVM